MLRSKKEKSELQEVEQNLLNMALNDDEGSSADIDDESEQKINTKRKRIQHKISTKRHQNSSSKLKTRKAILRASISEGKLSFCCALTSKHPEVAESLIASDIMTERELSEVKGFNENKKVLDGRKVKTFFGVDAQKLHEHPAFQERIPRVHINFLRCPGSYKDGKTQKTLKNIFSSVGDHLQEKGDKIYVVIPKRSRKQREQYMQVAQYELYDAAIAAGYKLSNKRRFDKNRYPEYNHHQTGNSGDVAEVEQYGGREFVFKKVAVSPSEKAALRQSYPPVDFFDIHGVRIGNLVPEIPTEDGSTDYYSAEEDENKLSNNLRNKNTVFKVTDEYVQNGQIKKVAKFLEETCNSSQISSYWDINDGFQAMALLGNEFNMKHAHYFITRIKGDPSWRAKPAADALLILAGKITRLPALQAMLMVTITLFEENYSGHATLMQGIIEFFDKDRVNLQLSNLLKQELESKIEAESKIDSFAELEDAILARSTKCFHMLKCVYSRGIAISFDDGLRTINLEGGINIYIEFERDFRTIKSFIASLKMGKVNPKPDALIKAGYVASVIPTESLDLLIYTALQDKNKVVSVSTFALKNQLITKERLAKLFLQLIQKAPQNIKGYWDVDGGFDAMAILGDHFSIDHADYFIKKIDDDYRQWPEAAVSAIKILVDNITQTAAIEALARIATYLHNKKPKIFDEVKDVITAKFKMAVLDDKVQLELLRTSNKGIFKQDHKMQDSSSLRSSNELVVSCTR